MATTTFVNGTTLTDESWFNDADRLIYDILGNPADIAAVRTALLGAQWVGAFTRDATTASGTQAITGVGFAGTFGMFIANINGSSPASWGFMNASSSISVFDDHANAADTYGISAARSIYISQAGGAAVQFDFNAFGADGFTFDVTKVGSPTGTITVQCAIFRI